MGEDIPRRMRRFQRGKAPTEDEVEERSTEIAIKEVDKFKDSHARYPKKDELEKISESVFSQLKDELKESREEKEEISSQIQLEEEDLRELEGLTGVEKENKKKSLLERRKARRAKLRGRLNEEIPEKKEEKSAGKKKEKEKVPIQDLGLDRDAPELLEKEDDFSGVESAEKDDIKKLVSVNELKNLENGLDDTNDFDLIEKEMETSENTCPTCNNKTKEFIYCPNCGQAFCDHCAKKIEVQQDSIKYTCPNCGTEFKKRKKM